jgi:hypothetical protein
VAQSGNADAILVLGYLAGSSAFSDMRHDIAIGNRELTLGM